jgi:hypothetical protein
MGFFNTIEEHLAVSFKATILGQTVTVEGVTYNENASSQSAFEASTGRQSIFATCHAFPAPVGSQWIAAYRRWDGRQWARTSTTSSCDRPAVDLTSGIQH